MKIKLGSKIFLSLLIFSLVIVPVKAEDLNNVLDDEKNKLEENAAKQEELRQEILRLQSESRSLANQIAYLESQIELTELEIEAQNSEIAAKEEELNHYITDIEELNTKLQRLKEFIAKLNVVLKYRVRSSYKKSQIDGELSLLFQAKDELQNLIGRFQYLKAVQEQDKRLMAQMTSTQADYNSQIENLQIKKNELEQIKQELTLAKGQLEFEKNTLGEQRAAKAYFLTLTQNDESNYQNLLAESLAEQSAIQSAISDIINKIISGAVTEGEQVEKGSIIGIQGATGLATGDHLHFGVYVKCGSYWCHTDPKPYLDAGIVSWPMKPHYISQWYGYTDFAMTSGIYSDNFHNGIDMYWDSGTPILAAESGNIHYTIDEYGGKGALIYHSDELMTLYWHLR